MANLQSLCGCTPNSILRPVEAGAAVMENWSMIVTDTFGKDPHKNYSRPVEKSVCTAGDTDARVIIVEGGFGGLAAAKALKHTRVQITLIDRNNHYLFQPLLYQVATSVLAPG
jgi:NADPH-dependent 2,4-dienoyl-CoA reductase/sulfur reductase-like enzyme